MDQWNVDDDLYGDFASNTAVDKKGDTNGKIKYAHDDVITADSSDSKTCWKATAV